MGEVAGRMTKDSVVAYNTLHKETLAAEAAAAAELLAKRRARTAKAVQSAVSATARESAAAVSSASKAPQANFFWHIHIPKAFSLIFYTRVGGRLGGVIGRWVIFHIPSGRWGHIPYSVHGYTDAVHGYTYKLFPPSFLLLPFLPSLPLPLFSSLS